MNAPVSVDGGTGANTLVIVGSEWNGHPEGDEHQGDDEHGHWNDGLDVDDHIVATGNNILGAGLNVTQTSFVGNEDDQGDEHDGIAESDEHDGGDGHDGSDEHDGHDAIDVDGGVFFLGVEGGEGNDGGDGENPSAIVAWDLTGISATVDHQVVTPPSYHDDDHGYDVESAGGIAVHVASATSGQIVIRESAGTSRVYEQGTTIDTFTVSLVQAPTANVYVNVSAAVSADAASGARTVLVSTDGGVTWDFAGVLTFLAGGTAVKTVMVKAIDDTVSEGPLLATVSLSSQSADPIFNHVAVRNVLAEVIDNDRAGLVITQSDGDTTVLAGALPQGIVDSYTIAPTMAPAAGKTVTIRIRSDQTDLVVTVTSSDSRYDAATRTITFDETNWTTPVTVNVAAVVEDHEHDWEHDGSDHHYDEWAGHQDDLEGLIIHALKTTTTTDAAYAAYFAANAAPVVNVQILGDENEGDDEEGDGDAHGYGDGSGDGHDNMADVYIRETDGSTLVVKGDPLGDTYTVRLTEAPTRPQQVQILSDGQTIASSAFGDARFTAATATKPAYVTFDSTNWWMPFTVRLTTPATAPATDPFQPIEKLAPTGDGHDGEGWSDGHGDSYGDGYIYAYGNGDGEHGFGDNGEGGLEQPTLGRVQSLLCADGTNDHDADDDDPANWYRYHDDHDGRDGDHDGRDHDWNDDDEGDSDNELACEDSPQRQPVILPNELGAGAPPEFTLLSNNLVSEATSPAGAVVTYTPAAAIGEVGTALMAYSQTSGTTFPLGTTTVTVTATDAGGNYAAPTTFTITVRDTTPPVITTWSPNLTVEATMTTGAVVTYVAATATDAVGPVTITYSKDSGATFGIGTTTVTVTATDAYGNRSTKTFTVKVQDTTKPVITLAPAQTLEANSSSGWRVVNSAFATTAFDAVGPITFTYTKVGGSSLPTYLPFGATSIVVTARDAYGNVSLPSTFVVTVVDTTAPVITAPNVTVEATSPTGAKAYFTPTATDAVGPVTLTVSRVSGSQFVLGTTTVTVTATDGRGNTTTQTFTVTVRDTTAPTITSVSGNLTVEATSSAGATATYAAATATDAVSLPVVITYSKASGTTFLLGTTTVTVTATDAAGNASTRTFTVTVRDSIAPVVTSVAPNVTAEATSSAGAVVTYAAATATDAVGVDHFSYSKASGATFALGVTTVTVYAYDAAGNRSAARTFTVTVRDTTKPIIVSAPDITVQATSASGWKVAWSAFTPTATDAVGPVTFTYNKAASTWLALGTYTVTVTATDGAGNFQTATFTLTVVDTTGPVITAPDRTIEATSAAGAAVTFAATATDAAGLVTSLTYSIPSGSIFAFGTTTTVTVTATDNHGNSSTKTFTVTVRDTTAPIITAISGNLVVAATSSAGATVTYAAATATDAVGPVTITYSKASGSLFARGVTYVTVTATDGAGNSATRTFWVWVY